MIRPARPEERAVICSSWIQSYASSEWAAYCTPKDDAHTEIAECRAHRTLKSHRVRGVRVWHAADVYWEGMRARMNRLLASSNVSVFVVDEPMVDGWIVRAWDRNVAHYVYVRQSARGEGVARKLVADLAGAPTRYTHLSRGVDVARLPSGWVFDPYLLEGT